jgi:hypothetical protein
LGTWWNWFAGNWLALAPSLIQGKPAYLPPFPARPEPGTDPGSFG